MSDIERAMIDGARRVELVGGLDVLAEALETAAPDLDVNVVKDYSAKLSEPAARRRLSSVARVLSFDQLADGLLADLEAGFRPLRADPAVKNPMEWTDSVARVVWSSTDLDIVRRS